MAFKLSDDGTLDTVVVCEECGEEVRFNYADSGFDAQGAMIYTLMDFIKWCLKDAEEDHECPIPSGNEDAWSIREGVK